jgi:formylglycine-generating enzyme required for sulfatase activity
MLTTVPRVAATRPDSDPRSRRARPRTAAARSALAVAVAVAAPAAAQPAAQPAGDRGAAAAVPIGDAFRIDRVEVPVARFDAFLKASGRTSTAEREGGGFEWGAGWERRPGWTFRAPSGAPARPDDPAALV